MSFALVTNVHWMHFEVYASNHKLAGMSYNYDMIFVMKFAARRHAWSL
jgi:hypothetical protein